MNNKQLTYLIGVLTLVGALWAAASQWFSLVNRVSNLEVHQQYEHGSYVVPSH